MKTGKIFFQFFFRKIEKFFQFFSKKLEIELLDLVRSEEG